MDSDAQAVGEAMQRLVEAADALPGAFRAEIGIYYHAGVTSPHKWQCLVEADIEGTQFDVWGSSPPEAIDRAIEEAWRRVP